MSKSNCLFRQSLKFQVRCFVVWCRGIPALLYCCRHQWHANAGECQRDPAHCVRSLFSPCCFFTVEILHLQLKALRRSYPSHNSQRINLRSSSAFKRRPRFLIRGRGHFSLLCPSCIADKNQWSDSAGFLLLKSVTLKSYDWIGQLSGQLKQLNWDIKENSFSFEIFNNYCFDASDGKMIKVKL